MTDKETMKLALEALSWEWGDEPPELIGHAIAALEEVLAQPEQEPVAVDGNTSDGYHTFNELYEFRKVYNAALFNQWAAGGKCSVHKSWRHHGGELCFGGGWFIVVAVLPNGQISNHYEAKDWDLFNIPETECALYEFDGHTSADVVTRLKAYTHPPQRTEQEPVGSVVRWMDSSLIHGWFGDPPPEGTLLYTHPPQRKPLSAEQVSEICAEWTDENGNTGSFGRRQIARAIEAAHGIKGEA